MKEFVEKLIGRLEEDYKPDIECFESKDDYEVSITRYNRLLNIVNQLTEEYKDKVIIDGQYCWQTCGANEHCKECNRLSNGSIDYYENYDCLAEEYNNGWIPCSERLPEENGYYLITIKYYHLHNDVTMGCFFDDGEWWKIDKDDKVIAWQPLPAPFKKGE